MIASTPKPPYYAVIFTSLRTDMEEGYEAMAEKMVELAAQQPGFLGYESARDKVGITISYWRSLEDIRNWKQNVEHLEAQQKGRSSWYGSYKVRVCKVEREYGFASVKLHEQPPGSKGREPEIVSLPLCASA